MQVRGSILGSILTERLPSLYPSLHPIYRAAPTCPALCQALGIEEEPELLPVGEGDNWQLYALTEDAPPPHAIGHKGGPPGEEVLGWRSASQCRCLLSLGDG